MRLRIVSSFLLSHPEPRYEPIWEGEITIPPHLAKNDEDVNGYIYRYFNVVEKGEREHLLTLDYKLPSLSPGDLIVWLPRSEQDDTRARIFMVDGIGFKEIHPGLGIMREQMQFPSGETVSIDTMPQRAVPIRPEVKED